MGICLVSSNMCSGGFIIRVFKINEHMSPLMEICLYPPTCTKIPKKTLKNGSRGSRVKILRHNKRF